MSSKDLVMITLIGLALYYAVLYYLWIHKPSKEGVKTPKEEAETINKDSETEGDWREYLKDSPEENNKAETSEEPAEEKKPDLKDITKTARDGVDVGAKALELANEMTAMFQKVADMVEEEGEEEKGSAETSEDKLEESNEVIDEVNKSADKGLEEENEINEEDLDHDDDVDRYNEEELI